MLTGLLVWVTALSPPSVLMRGGCLHRSTHSMKLIRILLLVAMVAFGMTPAMAPATTVGLLNPSYYPNLKLDGIVSLTSAYTNATTGYTDVTGLTVTLPATTGQYAKQFIKVCYNLDVTKSTSTTGIVAVYANGAVIADSARYITSAAGHGTLAGCYTVARAAATATVVKLQAKSGDSASFAIDAGQLEVQRWIQGG